MKLAIYNLINLPTDVSMVLITFSAVLAYINMCTIYISLDNNKFHYVLDRPQYVDHNRTPSKLALLEQHERFLIYV